MRSNEESTSQIIQACIGGVAADFRFTVFSKNVGIMIHRLGKVCNPLFDLHFTLWRNGGPNYMKEKRIWDAKQDAEWHLVTRAKRSYSDVAQSGSSHSAFQRLVFPEDYFSKNYAIEFLSKPSRDSSPAKVIVAASPIGTWFSHGHFQNFNFEQRFSQDPYNQDKCFLARIGSPH